jgi:putative Ca2+/H+ antiporter (TMEM165/GDT1 family)
MGVAIFVIVCICTAVSAHLLTRRFFRAVLLSALASAVVFQVIVSVQLGHLDPLFPIAFVVTLVAGIGISAFIGATLKLGRSEPKQ